LLQIQRILGDVVSEEPQEFTASKLDARSLLEFRFFLSPMSEPDLKTTLREFHEYFARSYEPHRAIAERIGVAKATILGLVRRQKPTEGPIIGARAKLRISRC
jgi:hypothetical protein